MSKKLYVAYGSNLNMEQMKYRCPGATLYGTGVIENYELQFKGQPNGAFATIGVKEGASVPVAVWEITERNEHGLDRYEGYPSHYFKQDVPVQLDGGEEVSAMVYIMNQRMQFGLPSTYYYDTVYEGYTDCGLDTDVLRKALQDSATQFYTANCRIPQQKTLFDLADAKDPLYDEDEEDSFCFSEGMQL